MFDYFNAGARKARAPVNLSTASYPSARIVGDDKLDNGLEVEPNGDPDRETDRDTDIEIHIDTDRETASDRNCGCDSERETGPNRPQDRNDADHALRNQYGGKIVMMGQSKNPLLDVHAVFEDDYLLVVFKPARVAVHADPFDSKTAGRFDYPDLQTYLENLYRFRLTLYHRLDRDTSGLVVFGKDPIVDRAMSTMFEKKQVRKSYMAVVEGRWQPQWNRVENVLRKETDRWSNQSELPGKEALTTFRLLSSGDTRSWVEAIPKTGRTHQIRLHCLERGCPIAGDLLYNPNAVDSQTEAPQALHAFRLDFKHPQTSESLRIIVPPPKYWTSIWLNGAGDPVTIEKKFKSFFTEA